MFGDVSQVTNKKQKQIRILKYKVNCKYNIWLNADDLEPCLVMSVRELWQRPMSHVTEPQLHDDEQDDHEDEKDDWI